MSEQHPSTLGWQMTTPLAGRFPLEHFVGDAVPPSRPSALCGGGGGGGCNSRSLRSGSRGARSGDTSDRGEPGLCRPRAPEDRNVLPTLGGGRLSRALLPPECWTKASSESSGGLYGPFSSKKWLRSVTLPGCPYPSDKHAEILLNRGSFHPTPHPGTQPVGLTLPRHLCPWDVPGTVRDSPPGLGAAGHLQGEEEEEEESIPGPLPQPAAGNGEEDRRHWAR